MNIAVLGSNGLLGSMLVPMLYLNESWNLIEINTSSKVNDLSIYENMEKIFKNLKVDVLINLVALANVDQCEINPPLAYNSNARILKNLQAYFKNTNVKIIHISTDHLYNNTTPSKETEISLENIYAYSKYLGELYLSKHQNHLIFRSNFFGKSNSTKNSFTDWLQQSASNNTPITLFNDVYFNPIHYSTLYNFIKIGIQKNITGTFNLGSSTNLNKADFSINFLNKINSNYKNYRIDSIRTNSTLARRPKLMVMNCELLEKTFKEKCPSLQEELQKAINEYH